MAATCTTAVARMSAIKEAIIQPSETEGVPKVTLFPSMTYACSALAPIANALTALNTPQLTVIRAPRYSGIASGNFYR